jgi:hypothetical protein
VHPLARKKIHPRPLPDPSTNATTCRPVEWANAPMRNGTGSFATSERGDVSTLGPEAGTDVWNTHGSSSRQDRLTFGGGSPPTFQFIIAESSRD